MSLLIVILALNLLSHTSAPHQIGVTLAIVWMAIVCVGAPIAIVQRLRDERQSRHRFEVWENDPIRMAIDRIGLDLAAGRLPVNLDPEDVARLESAATEWRHGRDSLDSLSWAQAGLADTRDELREQMNVAMRNLLAEAGAGCSLGLSPFALERARNLFREIAREAGGIAETRSAFRQFETDASIEAMRPALERLRFERILRTEGEESATLARTEG